MTTSTLPTRHLAGITVPDTPLITQAIALAREHLDDIAYNHIMRSFLFGVAIADKLSHLVNRDRELHSIAALLHDLGWDIKQEFVSADKRFEVDGANAARDFIDGENAAGWDHHRKQLLWDAIALHTSPSIAHHKEAEVVATSFGILTEFTGQAGAPGGVLTQQEWEDITKEFPRNEFKDGVAKVMCGLCRTKPETTYDNFVADFGEAMVEGYTRQGFRAFDLMMAMED